MDKEYKRHLNKAYFKALNACFDMFLISNMGVPISC